MKFESLEQIKIDMGDRPEGRSLDRIDPFGNYYKENCRWATHFPQMNARRCNHATKEA